MLSTLFGDTPINFASWMGFACPIMLLNLGKEYIKNTISFVL